MCGIVGVLRFGDPTTPSYNTSALYLATTLLEVSEKRGEDATGVTALFDDGNFFVQKMAVSSTEFCNRTGGKPDDYEGLLALLRGYSKAPFRCLIGHCRKKSAGALNNVDNHPIKAGNILGVHNGTLKNDDTIFENLGSKRDGKVDSEAIFRMLQFFTHNCEDPFTLDSVEEVCKRLEGTFSFLAYNANNPYQLVSARDGRPAEYCLIKPLGLLLIASEKKFIDLALWKYNKLAKLFPTGNPDTEFIPLKKSDVVHASLAHDTMAIFDMTKTISETTKVADLYVSRKIPFLVDRLWKSPITSSYTNNNFNGRNNSTVLDKKKETTNHTGKNDKKSSDTAEDNGRVWNTTLNTFVKNFRKKELVSEGALVNVEKDTITDLVGGRLNISKDEEEFSKSGEVKKTASDMETGLKKSKRSVENFTSGEAVVFFNKSLKSKTNTKTDKVLATGKAIIEMKRGIEKGKNAVAGELRAKEAVIEAVKGLERFKTAADVANFIDIDESSLESLPPEALTNRLVKKLFGKFFLQGWLDCHDNTNNSSNNKDIEKLEKAEKHVQALKNLQTCLLQELATDGDTASLDIVTETAKTLFETGEVAKDTLKGVFSTGDLRKSAALRRIMTAL